MRRKEIINVTNAPCVCVCFRARARACACARVCVKVRLHFAIGCTTGCKNVYVLQPVVQLTSSRWSVPTIRYCSPVLKGTVKICHKKTTTTSHRSVSSAISTGLPLISSKHTDRPRYKCGIEWRGGATAGHRTCDQEVAVSSPGPAWLRNDSGQVVHTHTSLLPSSIIWYLESWNVNTHTHIRLTALFPGLPGWAGNRKVKPIWILLKQETVSGSGISWAICKTAPRSRQITTPVPHHSVFYRPDALPAAQPTVSNHWRDMHWRDTGM